MSLICTAASERHYRGDFDAHAHDHAQVLIGLRGHLEIEVEGHPAFVDASCGLVVPAGSRHVYQAAAPAHMLVLDVPPQRGLDRCRRFLASPQWRTAQQTLSLAELIGEVLQAPRAHPRRAIRLDDIDAAIDAQLHANWSTRRLAESCFMSAQRFHARFVELTGKTPMEHVRMRRLAVARQLLGAGWSLEATALHVGYARASALGHALRRDLGTSARTLRRAMVDTAPEAS